VRAPVEVVIRNAGVAALETAYNVRLPRPTAADQQDKYALSKVQLWRVLTVSRVRMHQRSSGKCMRTQRLSTS